MKPSPYTDALHRDRYASMRIEDIRQRLRALGAKPIHEQRVLRLWAQALPQEGGKRRPEDFLPQALRDGLPCILADIEGLAGVRVATVISGAGSPSRTAARRRPASGARRLRSTSYESAFKGET